MSLSQQVTIKDFNKIDRVEIIEELGKARYSNRAYVRWKCTVQISLQDDGKTLKLFVGERK